MKRALLLILLAGCAAEPDDDLGSTQEAITNANLTSSAPYTISLRTRWGGCTAVVISRHWVITSAHCFAGTPGSENVCMLRGTHADAMTVSFKGVGTVYIHPSYTPFPATNNQSFDFALIRIPGEGLNAFDAARVYVGPETPWTSKGPLVDAVGYGFGSDGGGASDCPATDSLPPPTGYTLGDKRRAHFAFSGGRQILSGVTQAYNFYSTLRATCHGDSGGPSLLVRGGEDYVTGLLSTGQFDAGGINTASMIEPKLAWIQQIAGFVGPRLSCALIRDHRDPQEVDYRACTEPDFRPSPLPPTTWSDCDDMLPGNAPPM